MRKIEVRAWDKENKSMEYVGELDFSHPRGSNPGVITHICLDKFDTSYPIEDFILMLYTGKRDKNRVKVFEGDFLEVDSGKRIVEVYWHEYQARFDTRLVKIIESFSSFRSLQNGEFSTKCKVIGNIFTRPDLTGE